MATRSMLQVMLELGVLAQVPEADIAGGKATPGAGSVPSPTAERPPLLNIMSGAAPPPEAYVAIQYKGRWFWIADDRYPLEIHIHGRDAAVFDLRCRRALGPAGRHCARQLNFLESANGAFDPKSCGKNRLTPQFISSLLEVRVSSQQGAEETQRILDQAFPKCRIAHTDESSCFD